MRRRYRNAIVLAGVAAVVVGAGAGAIAMLVKSRHKQGATAPAAVVAAKNTDKKQRLVLILGIDNRTGDPMFDGTIATLLNYALRRSAKLDPVEGGHLSALAAELDYDGPPDNIPRLLDARGNGGVLGVRGFVAVKSGGYVISITARNAANAVVFEGSRTAASATDVVSTTGQLVAELRDHLGDKVPDAERAMTNLSSNLEADHQYSIGARLQRVADDASAIPYFEAALAKDPSFALAHADLGLSYSNSQRIDEADAQYKLALKSIAQLGEREKMKVLGDYYLLSKENDLERSVASYRKLLEQWPADQETETNLMIALLARHDVPAAAAASKHAVENYPHDIFTATNSVSLAVLQGDGAHAIELADKVNKMSPRPDPLIQLYVGLANYLLDRSDEALASFERYEKSEESRGAFAKADLAIARGRLSEAAAMLEAAAARDEKSNLDELAERKYAALAEIRLRQGNKAAAIANATKVTNAPLQRYVAALVLLHAGARQAALLTARSLVANASSDIRALGKLIEGEDLRLQGKAVAALETFEASLALSNTWQGHFLSALAALDEKRFGVAFGELGTCIDRRGEIVLSADDVPSMHDVPRLQYYLGLAKRGLGSNDAAEAFKAYIASQEGGESDAMLEDARRQAGAAVPQ